MIQKSTYHEQTQGKIVRDPFTLRDTLNNSHSQEAIVLVKGVYDLFHIGHYHSFVNAKMYGDLLVVAVNGDMAVKQRKGRQRPINNQNDRMLLVASLGCVDWVTLYEEISPYEVIRLLRPKVFMASHFESLSPDERVDLQQFVRFQNDPKLNGKSSTNIIQRIREVYP